MRALARLWGAFSALLTPRLPQPSLSTPEEHPLRLPDLWGGFRLRPMVIGEHRGWVLTNRHGAAGFLHQRPEDGFWCCCVFEHDKQPRMLSAWDMTPEGSLMRFLEER